MIRDLILFIVLGLKLGNKKVKVTVQIVMNNPVLLSIVDALLNASMELLQPFINF